MVIIALICSAWVISGFLIARYGLNIREGILLFPLALGIGTVLHFFLLNILLRLFPTDLAAWGVLLLMLLFGGGLWYKKHHHTAPIYWRYSGQILAILLIIWIIFSYFLAQVTLSQGLADEIDHGPRAAVFKQYGMPFSLTLGGYAWPEEYCNCYHYAEGSMAGILSRQSNETIFDMFLFRMIYNSATALGLCFIFLWELLRRQRLFLPLMGAFLFIFTGPAQWLSEFHELPIIGEILPQTDGFARSVSYAQLIDITQIGELVRPIFHTNDLMVPFTEYLNSPNPVSFFVVAFLTLFAWYHLRQSSQSLLMYGALGVLTATCALYFTTGIIIIAVPIILALLWDIIRSESFLLPMQRFTAFIIPLWLMLFFQGGAITDLMFFDASNPVLKSLLVLIPVIGLLSVLGLIYLDHRQVFSIRVWGKWGISFSAICLVILFLTGASLYDILPESAASELRTFEERFIPSAKGGETSFLTIQYHGRDLIARGWGSVSLLQPTDWVNVIMDWGLALVMLPILILYSLWKKQAELVFILLGFATSIILPFVTTFSFGSNDTYRFAVIPLWFIGALSVFVLTDLWQLKRMWRYVGIVFSIFFVLALSLTGIVNGLSRIQFPHWESDMMSPLDVQVNADYGGTLDPDTERVWDPFNIQYNQVAYNFGVARAIVVFENYSSFNGNLYNYIARPSTLIWSQMFLPGDLRNEGYGYLYISSEWFNNASSYAKTQLQNPELYELIQEWSDDTGDFRRLYRLGTDRAFNVVYEFYPGLSPDSADSLFQTTLPFGMTEDSVIYDPIVGDHFMYPSIRSTLIGNLYENGYMSQEDAFSFIQILSQVESQFNLSPQYQTTTIENILTDWRFTKAPQSLRAAGFDYLLVDQFWLAWLSEEEYNTLHNPEYYILEKVWDFPLNGEFVPYYYLYRAVPQDS